MQRLVGYKQKAVLALLSVYFRHYSIELDLVWGLKQQGNGKTGIDTQTRLKVTFLTPQAAVVDLDVEQTPPHKHSRTRTVHLCLLYCNSSCLMRAENNHLSLLPWQCPSCPMSISYLSFHSLLKQTLLSRCGKTILMQCSLFTVRLSFGILFIQTSCRNFRWQIHLKTNLQNSHFSLKPDKINLYIFISSAWIFFLTISSS